MQVEDALERLLADYAARTGLPPLSLDAAGICALRFADRAVLHMTVDAAGATVLFYARVGEVPPDRRPAVHRELLVANARGGHLGTLAVDERDEAVLVVHRASVDALDGPGFERLIEGLAETALHWMEALSGAPRTTSSAPGAEDSIELMRFAIRG